MTDEELCRDLCDAPDPNEDEACQHWHTRGLCGLECSCGHGCGEHWAWGGCSICACLAWEDARDAAPRGLALRPCPGSTHPDPGADPFDDLDEAAGF
jgi:hypothetical protein